MKTDVTVPEVGESVAGGVLAAWLKRSGDAVTEGEDLFELETDKATLSVPAPASGVLDASVEEDTEVQVGQSVGSIDTSAAASGAGGAGSAAGEPAEARPAAAQSSGDVTEAGRTGWTLEDLPAGARRVAAEHKVDVSAITGTGKGGRVTKEDVLRAIDEQTGGGKEPAQPGPAESQPEKAGLSSGGPAQGGSAQTRKKLTSLRKRIAANLVRSKQNAAHLTTFNEVDMSKVMEIRSRHKEQFEKKHDIKLGFMSFFVKASQKALEAYPEVNAFLEEEEIVYNHFYNVGVALSSDRGLMTPVIRNVESRSFADIERRIIEFMEKASNKKIMPDELTGGTFTISNGGVFGSMLSTPIPNPPQTAVLGMHTIQKRAVVVNDEIVVRPMMYLALSYDHRMIDGREAIGFLNTIKEAIEDPTRMLLDL